MGVAEPPAATGSPRNGTHCVPLSKGANDRWIAQIAARRPPLKQQSRVRHHYAPPGKAQFCDSSADCFLRHRPPVARIMHLVGSMRRDLQQLFSREACEMQKYVDSSDWRGVEETAGCHALGD